MLIGYIYNVIDKTNDKEATFTKTRGGAGWGKRSFGVVWASCLVIPTTEPVARGADGGVIEGKTAQREWASTTM